jgi:hypothetical protein
MVFSSAIDGRKDTRSSPQQQGNKGRHEETIVRTVCREKRRAAVGRFAVDVGRAVVVDVSKQT